MSLTDIRIAFNGRQCNYWHMAAISLLFYDHFLTFKTEIKCLWKRQLNSSGCLFFLHRYFNPIAMVITFVSLFSNLPVSCKAWSNVREGILIVAQLIVTFVMTMRVYALYGCNKRLLYLLFAIIAIFLCVAAITTFTAHSTPPVALPSGECSTQLDFNNASRAAVAWMTIFIYDVLIFGLAVHNAFKTKEEFRMFKTFEVPVSLRVILLRDGAIYFGVITIINLANILSFYLLEDCMRGGFGPFASSLSVTLVSRLMLNLHQVNDAGIASSQSHLEVETQIVFHRRSTDGYDD
ncbi:hypothetical protein GYMLUDRAFT_832492 [Collybiopsis luxurians FD-317 M1]|uniref:DUF6533 domain-containing protein n=1 Tax=Collybiopsis luxurians FD-317 M1 TaxID=944289 RepID=A0A0D0CCP1_9AGAR|nr:hypothetical protein GYMLUDRAFT_832492 [Collybiopsis luxurians FD-317 M1]